MAILHASKQWSAATAKSRLKQISREHKGTSAPELPLIETLVALPAPEPATPTAAKATENRQRQHPERLSEIEQRQLLLQAVGIYKGWHLVSVQHRPESDVLVAHVVRNNDPDDPVLAIREGRSMQITMDAMGDLKVQHPRAGRKGLGAQLMRKLRLFFARNAGIFSPYGML